MRKLIQVNYQIKDFKKARDNKYFLTNCHIQQHQNYRSLSLNYFKFFNKSNELMANHNVQSYSSKILKQSFARIGLNQFIVNRKKQRKKALFKLGKIQSSLNLLFYNFITLLSLSFIKNQFMDTFPSCEQCGSLKESPEFQCMSCVVKSQNSIVKCCVCGFQNDILNTSCVSCLSEEFANPEERLQCFICNQKVKITEYESHLENCELSMKMIKEQQEKEKLLSLMEKCKYCRDRLMVEDLLQHENVCPQKPVPIKTMHYSTKKYSGSFNGSNDPDPIINSMQFQLEGELSKEEIERLTPVQIQAIAYMHKNAKYYNNIAQTAFLSRMVQMGYSEVDLKQVKEYIEKKAPLIIHVNFQKYIPYFLSDTHYRNLFETSQSSGSKDKIGRAQKEDKIFRNAYHRAQNFQRIKYGVMNMTNDPKGVQCCSQYGKSYFLLKQHLRPRVTITGQNSFSSTPQTMGTLNNCSHILSKMNEKEFISIVTAALGFEESSKVTSSYKQIQIHGPIEFTKDIEAIWIDKSEVESDDNLEKLLEFIQKNEIRYQFI